MWGTTLERDREKISMTGEEFKTIMEMVRMIVDGSKDKEDALRKIDSLTILKGNDKNQEKSE